MNTDILLFRRRFRPPETAAGWIFFVISFVLLIIAGNDELLKKISGDPTVRRIIRVILIILCIVSLSASAIADFK